MFFNTIKKFNQKSSIFKIIFYKLYMLFNHFYVIQTYLVIELVNYFYFI